MRQYPPLVLALCAFLLATSGCSDDGSETSGEGGTAAAAGSGASASGGSDPSAGGSTAASGGSDSGSGGSTAASGGSDGAGGKAGDVSCDPLATGTDGVYMEVEVVAPVGEWTESSSTPGYNGESYFRWPDKKIGAPKDGDRVLSYCFELGAAGDYLLEIRGRRDTESDFCAKNAAGKGDGCNDIFVQIDGKGAQGQTWTKKMIKGKWGVWHWDGKWDPKNGSPHTTVVPLGRGTHILNMAGRSHSVKLDAIRVYRDGTSPPSP